MAFPMDADDGVPDKSGKAKTVPFFDQTRMVILHDSNPEKDNDGLYDRVQKRR